MYFRILSHRTYRIFQFIRNHVSETTAAPTLQAICFYFGAGPEAVNISLAVLDRHRFIAREINLERRIQIIDRTPLLMPYWGNVR